MFPVGRAWRRIPSPSPSPSRRRSNSSRALSFVERRAVERANEQASVSPTPLPPPPPFSMVSPTPATTAHPPVLSYAESAKKAQGVKPPSLQAQKHLSNPPRQPAPPAFAAEPKKPGKPSSPVEAAQISLADLSLHDVSTPSAPGANLSSHSSNSESTAQISNTREVPAHDPPSAGVPPPTPTTQPPSAKAAPVPNVWNQRIQQRAQARSQPRPPQSLPQTASSHAPCAPSPPQDSSAAPSGLRQPDVMTSASVQSTQSPPSSNLNGASSSTSGSSAGTTPASRKDLPLSPHPPPLVADAESWPEVGKGHTPTGKSQRVSNGHPAVATEVHDAEEKDADAPSPSHPGTPRKSAFFSSRSPLRVYALSLPMRVLSVLCSFPMIGAYNLQPLFLFSRSSS